MTLNHKSGDKPDPRDARTGHVVAHPVNPGDELGRALLSLITRLLAVALLLTLFGRQFS